MLSVCKVFIIVFTLNFTVHAQKRENGVLPAEKIAELIPKKLDDYSPNATDQSKLIAFGEVRYSMTERNFVGNRKRLIKILLFDFKEAPIMFKQATRNFSAFTPIDSDSLVVRSLVMTDCSGWETFNAKRNFSQILLGVCDRFFLTVEGTNVGLDELKKVVQTFKFDAYPK